MAIAGATAQLVDAVDQLRSEDLSAPSSARLKADLLELEIQSRALDAERLRRLAEVDRRGDFADEGYLSTAAWLRDRTHTSFGHALQRVAMARRLAAMALTRAAFAAGRIGWDAVRLLASARDAHPEHFVSDEATLVSAAGSLPPHALRRALEHWKDAYDPEHVAASAEAKHRRRFVHASRTFDGMLRLDAELDPEGGAIVLSALRSRTESGSLDPSDTRTGAQRRADALVDICHHDLDHGDAPVSGGERPHLEVSIDLGALTGGRGLATVDEVTVPAETARRLACDAGVIRIITKGPSEPLDVGRRTRTVPSAIRRALNRRDGGCTAPGCDRPQRWCDAHHVVHWADGGETSLDNLVLLCRRHHRMVHEGTRSTTVGARGREMRAPPEVLV
jgi:hypothetical protein